MTILLRNSIKIIKKNFILICFTFISLFSTFCSYSKDSIRISGQLKNNTRFVKVVVQKFGIGVFDIAAIPVDKVTGKFEIYAPKDFQSGIYRFRYSQTGKDDYVDVIVNGKDKNIDFSIDVTLEPHIRYPIFTNSQENITWYQFVKKQNKAILELQVKHEFISKYPNKNDKSYLFISKEFDTDKQNISKSYQLFVTQTPFYWAKQLAKYNRVYITNPNQFFRLQLFNEHESFWEGKPTKDTLLINTPLYTDAILNYIKYYMNPDMEFGEEEKNVGFIKSVDTIVKRFSSSEMTKEFAIKYLQLGFKEIGNEMVLKYIDEKYAITEQCTQNDENLKKRLAGYETLKIGNYAPSITLTNSDGKETTLYDFSQDSIVLVFWASWCPHCMEEMPNLQSWAKEHPSVLVLSISLDEDYGAYLKAVEQFPNLLHYCDLQKWEGDIVKSYFVSATPTIYLLDKNRKFMGKFDGIQKFIN